MLVIGLVKKRIKKKQKELGRRFDIEYILTHNFYAKKPQFSKKKQASIIDILPLLQNIIHITYVYIGTQKR